MKWSVYNSRRINKKYHVEPQLLRKYFKTKKEAIAYAKSLNDPMVILEKILCDGTFQEMDWQK